ncbi:NADH-quinone oxidoreductase subunit NuoE family protein [Clostridium sp.]|uniref:NADH-quinone oxidoreductase subunit NuoE family protein n=1 Tax=Clostridium sp. TaxID=1506 RepID=UPI002634EF71|nr:NAD(P)H-dependent oxidoreductase subunit E [uncultured Clostridium sp.]
MSHVHWAGDVDCKRVKVGETTKDGIFTLMYTPCFGACDISPVFRIDENVVENLNNEKIKNIIQSYRMV